MIFVLYVTSYTTVYFPYIVIVQNTIITSVHSWKTGIFVD